MAIGGAIAGALGSTANLVNSIIKGDKQEKALQKKQELQAQRNFYQRQRQKLATKQQQQVFDFFIKVIPLLVVVAIIIILLLKK